MRGAPYKGFSALIRRINARSSASIFGWPPRERDFQRQYRRKPARCQRTRVSGPDDRDGLADRWKPAIQHDQERDPIRQLEATAHTPLQHNHLMSECGVLASSRLFDLNGEVSRLRKKQSSAIIAAEVWACRSRR